MPFCNWSLPVADRVRDLVGRLTLEEKLLLTSADNAPLLRLGIPGYTWGNECLHGAVVRPGQTGTGPKGGATVFPQPVAWAASFDEDLALAIGTAVSDESRALSNNGGAQSGDRPAFLDCWAPNINIFRDPRWGRGSETFGEDPMLTARLAKAVIQGLQGPDAPLASAGGSAAAGKYVKVIAVPKHYAAYSLEEADGLSRFWFDAVVTPQDLEDTYLPAWVEAVGAGARGVMCSYNEINGTAMCANRELLDAVLRGQYGFSGHVVSDCGAVGNIHATQRLAPTVEAAAAMALLAGTDLNCGDAYGALNVSVAKGLVKAADVDRAVSRTLAGRFELGQFDPAERNPFASIPVSVVGSSEHVALARRAAVESVVLLKNLDGLAPGQAGRPALPLRPGDLKRVAVVGPHANDTLVQLGNYHGDPAGGVVTPLAALSSRLSARGVDVRYSAGCAITGDGAWQFGDAVAAAADADVAVVFVGSSSKGSIDGQNHLDTVEKESMDRVSIALPPVQQDLLLALASQTTTPVVVVLVHGGPLAVEWAAASDRVRAVVAVGYPGQEAGSAIADVLLGDASPSGRLPVTWYHANYTTQVRSTDMRMRPWPGRTHRFVRVPVLWPFGHGLSYAWFSYGPVAVKRSPGGGAVVSVTVARAAASAVDAAADAVPADEVVLLFATPAGETAQRGSPRPTKSSARAAAVAKLAPRQKLVGFRRVRAVAPGENQTVVFSLAPRDLHVVDEGGVWQSGACWWLHVGVPTGGAHVARAATVCSTP